MLTNAIYFNAAWQFPFSANATSPQVFRLLDGGSSSVSMMHQQRSFAYLSAEGLQAVEIPYDDPQLSMLVVMPPAGQFASYETSLSSEIIDSVVAQLAVGEIQLGLPKFEFEAEFKLKDTLQQFGMTDAFDPALADLSGMTGDQSLFVSAVVQQAFVAVNEKGTEAAAATAVVGELSSAAEPAPELVFDRPFIFAIRDVPTNTTLFVGRVLNPQG